MQAKKSLGQNFLIDNNVLDKISANIKATSEDLIIEIGPGMGALTRKLKEKGVNLICYEIDKDLEKYLNPLLDEKTKIIYEDILKSDFKQDLKDYSYNNLYVVGNLPYYITTPIIKHLIEMDTKIKEMLFMVQEEVADRFTAHAKTKDYGSITLFLKYYYDIEKLFKVSKNSFNPAPKVESAIIRFKERIDKPNVNKDVYFKLITDSFKMKRKTLKNNLSEYDFNKIKEVLKEYGLSENVRAEELEEEVFIKIANTIYEENYEE